MKIERKTEEQKEMSVCLLLMEEEICRQFNYYKWEI